MKTALITGVTGMDGSHLAELLLDKGYEVHGILRRASTFNRSRIEHLRNYDNPVKDNPLLHYGDMTDSTNISRLVREIQPDEIYHLAAQSHVKASFDIPEYTADADGLGTLRLLEASREFDIKFYNASTSELFGKARESPQNEKTPFHPRSPYGVAKLYSHWITCNYREAYGLFACNGILFNHEGERRGAEFVTRRITLAIARIVAGRQKRIYLGNLNAERDWGYAPEYVKAMWMMLQQKKPEDYIIATGKTNSIRKFVELSFAEIDIPIIWQGKGVDEKGIDENTGKIMVEVSPELFRPAEVDCLCGDASKARKQLGWKPEKTLGEIVKIMVRSDLNIKNIDRKY